MAQSVKCFPSNTQSPRFMTQHCTKLGVVMHTCNSSILEVEAGSQVQGQHGLQKLRREGVRERKTRNSIRVLGLGGEGREELMAQQVRRLPHKPGDSVHSQREPTLQCCPLASTYALQHPDITLPKTQLAKN